MVKIQVAVILFLCVILFLASGCTHRSENARTLLTKDEVIAIAKDTAKSEGLDIWKYNMTGCHYEYARKDGTWAVSFELKQPTLGGHFLVLVDDKTKKAKLISGR